MESRCRLSALLADVSQVTGTAAPYPSSSVLSCTAVLADPPPQLVPGPNVTVSPGETAILSCQVLGDAPYNLTWVRDWRALPATAGRVTQLHDLSLEVGSIVPSDGGQYQCVASNANGVSRASTWLLVRGEAPPTLAGPLVFTGDTLSSSLCLTPEPLEILSHVHYWRFIILGLGQGENSEIRCAWAQIVG